MQHHPIDTFLRLRPHDEERPVCIIVDGSDEVYLVQPAGAAAAEGGVRIKYTFTRVFDGRASQKEVFDETAKPLISGLLEGSNGLLFTYGVTGSGKTHTMHGPRGDPGIISRSLDSIFNSIQNVQAQRDLFRPDGRNGFSMDPISSSGAAAGHEAPMTRGRTRRADMLWVDKLGVASSGSAPGHGHRSDSASSHSSDHHIIDPEDRPTLDLTCMDVDEDSVYAVFISFVDVYNDAYYDLLEVPTNADPRSKAPAKRAPKTIGHDRNMLPFLKGLTEVEIKSTAEGLALLRRGQQNRQVAHTRLNAASSRGHAVLTVRLVRAPLDERGRYAIRDPSRITCANLSLVDLAGSERNNRTQNTGERQQEANFINTSLSTLSRCISTLRSRQQGATQDLVPYRDSKLTNLFKGAFEGHARISVIVCASPGADDYEENVHVMRFAVAAQSLTMAVSTPALDRVHAGMTPGRGGAFRIVENAILRQQSQAAANAAKDHGHSDHSVDVDSTAANQPRTPGHGINRKTTMVVETKTPRAALWGGIRLPGFPSLRSPAPTAPSVRPAFVPAAPAASGSVLAVDAHESESTLDLPSVPVSAHLTRSSPGPIAPGRPSMAVRQWESELAEQEDAFQQHFLSQHHEFTKMLEKRFRQALDTKNAELDATKARLQAASDEVNLLKMQLSERRNTAQHAQDRIQSLDSQLVAAQRSLKETQEELAKCRQSNANLETLVTTLQQALCDEVKRCEESIKQKEGDVRQMRRAVEDLEQRLRAKDEEKAQELAALENDLQRIVQEDLRETIERIKCEIENEYMRTSQSERRMMKSVFSDKLERLGSSVAANIRQVPSRAAAAAAAASSSSNPIDQRQVLAQNLAQMLGPSKAEAVMEANAPAHRAHGSSTAAVQNGESVAADFKSPEKPGPRPLQSQFANVTMSIPAEPSPQQSGKTLHHVTDEKPEFSGILKPAVKDERVMNTQQTKTAMSKKSKRIDFTNYMLIDREGTRTNVIKGTVTPSISHKGTSVQFTGVETLEDTRANTFFKTGHADENRTAADGEPVQRRRDDADAFSVASYDSATSAAESWRSAASTRSAASSKRALPEAAAAASKRTRQSSVSDFSVCEHDEVAEEADEEEDTPLTRSQLRNRCQIGIHGGSGVQQPSTGVIRVDDKPKKGSTLRRIFGRQSSSAKDSSSSRAATRKPTSSRGKVC
jgi:hypothetical protein